MIDLRSIACAALVALSTGGVASAVTIDRDLFDVYSGEGDPEGFEVGFGFPSAPLAFLDFTWRETAFSASIDFSIDINGTLFFDIYDADVGNGDLSAFTLDRLDGISGTAVSRLTT